MTNPKEFFYNGNPVGVFVNHEEFPEMPGVYRYDPYRGTGHYELVTSLKIKPQICQYSKNNKIFNAKISSITNMGVAVDSIEIHDKHFVEELIGMEYDWLAIDTKGQIGFFSTAGSGYVPKRHHANQDFYASVGISLDSATEKCVPLVYPTKEGAKIDLWIEMTGSGIYAFDFDIYEDEYKLIAKPSKPQIISNLSLVVPEISTLKTCHIDDFNNARTAFPY